MENVDEEVEFNVQLMQNMLKSTYGDVWEAAGHDLQKAVKIQTFMRDIIQLGKDFGYPPELYMALFILTKSCAKMVEVSHKWGEMKQNQTEENSK